MAGPWVAVISADHAASIATARRLGCVEDPSVSGHDPADIVFRHPGPECLQ